MSRFLPNKILAISSYAYNNVVRNGYLRSLGKGVPIDRQGMPLPWITYPAIEFINQLDLAKAMALEIGSGYSTVWLSTRCMNIHSLETSDKWIDAVSSLLITHGRAEAVNLCRVSIPEAYPLCEESEDWKKGVNKAFADYFDSLTFEDINKSYDFIFIDGWGFNRGLIAKIVIDAKLLSDGGIIVVEDSKQCPEACKFLRSKEFSQVPFVGFSPGGTLKETSVFSSKYL